jgi:ATP-dependent Clp protease ATP-binding subunit ClpB
MNLNNFTIKSQEAVQQAVQLATVNGQQAIENGHLLKGILEVDENVTPFILKKLNVNTPMFTKALDKIIEGYPKVSGGQPYLSNNANQAVAKASTYLKEFGDEYVSIEHLLLAILTTKDTISQLMKDETYNSLNKYAKNLNELAKTGKLDPVIGRDEEIRRVLQILTRRTKNNPMLVGEPGVGKTAIAEGLAHRIVDGDVPENLKDKIVFL